MTPKKPMRPPNPAARALKENEFRQRIVKSKKNAAYTRKEKHKKREDPKPDFPFSIYSHKHFIENSMASAKN